MQPSQKVRNTNRPQLVTDKEKVHNVCSKEWGGGSAGEGNDPPENKLRRFIWLLKAKAV